MPPGGQLVGDDSQRKHVAGAAGRLTASLFGRHVGQRACRPAGIGPGFIPRENPDSECPRNGGRKRAGNPRRQQAGQAEVDDLHLAVRAGHDVFGFDVSVDDTGGMGGRQRHGGLADESRQLVGPRATCDQPAKCLAFDQLHDDERSSVVLAQGMDRTDAGMVEGRCRAGFPQEPRQLIGGARIIIANQLDGDVAAQTGFAGLIDDSHAAAPDRLHDLVAGHARQPVFRHRRDECGRGRRSHARCDRMGGSRQPGMQREMASQPFFKVGKPPQKSLQRRRLSQLLP